MSLKRKKPLGKRSGEIARLLHRSRPVWGPADAVPGSFPICRVDAGARVNQGLSVWGRLAVVSEVGSGSPVSAGWQLPGTVGRVRRMVSCGAHLAERKDSRDYQLMARDLVLSLALAGPSSLAPMVRGRRSGGRLIPTHHEGLHRKVLLQDC